MRRRSGSVTCKVTFCTLQFSAIPYEEYISAKKPFLYFLKIRNFTKPMHAPAIFLQIAISLYFPSSPKPIEILWERGCSTVFWVSYDYRR